MNVNGKSDFEDRGLAFFGRLTASVSHEINNVLAIINELSGLLDDVLKGSGEDCGKQIDRLTKASGGIQKQVQRGKGIIQRLNRFAHSVDEWVSTFDVKVALKDVVDNARRFAYRKGVSLEADLSGDGVSITSSLFFTQLAVFACIESVVDITRSGGTVTVTCLNEDECVKICIRSSDASWGDDPGTELRATGSVISGIVDLLTDETGQAIACSSLTLFHIKQLK